MRRPSPYRNQFPLLLAIVTLSASLIAFQVALMQLLSITQWHHFAYMVISIALLGFGVSGTILSLYRKKLLSHFYPFFPLFILLSLLSIPGVVYLSQLPALRFDSYLLFTGPRHLPRLWLLYLLYLFPFFWGALSLGMVFAKFPQNIGKLYFSNLLGSGVGGLIILPIMNIFLPQQIPAILALIGVAGCAPFITKNFQRGWLFLLLGILYVSMWIAVVPPISYSQFKGIHKTLLLPDARIQYEKNSPYGFIQVVSSPVLRYAPGLSLSFTDSLPIEEMVFLNGEALGPLLSYKQPVSRNIFHFTTEALPYLLSSRINPLILQAGTGSGIVRALVFRSPKVTAVEPNSALVRLLLGKLAPLCDSLWWHPSLTIVSQSPRSFLLRDTTHYDLIEVPIVGAFGGTVGLRALQEQYLLTVESYIDMWNRLAPDGVLSVSCWLDYPLRNPLKVAATIAEMFEALHIPNPTEQIVVIKNWGNITFLVKKRPFTPSEARQIYQFCQKRFFTPIMMPPITSQKEELSPESQNEELTRYLQMIFSRERAQFYRSYSFNIQPATDEKPYFSQFLRWKQIPQLMSAFGTFQLPFFELGYWIILLTLLQVIIISFLCIILPLFRLKGSGSKRFAFMYFSGIGIGFMFIEIVLIQRFIFYFGNPIYAAAITLSGILIFSGVGSYLSSRVSVTRVLLRRFLLSVGTVCVVYSLFLPLLLKSTIAFPISIKAIISTMVLAFPGILMGFPFPLGIRYLSIDREWQIPWAWGINGCFSVISAVLAALLAVEIGFRGVLLAAALAYTGASLATVHQPSD